MDALRIRGSTRTLMTTAAVLVLSACGAAPKGTPSAHAPMADVVTSPSAAVVKGPAALASSRALADIADDYWQSLMQASPLWATSLGDRRRDSELGSVAAVEIARHRKVVSALRERLKFVDQTELAPAERVTAELLEFELETTVAVDLACHEERWTVDQLYGPQVYFGEIPNYHTIDNAQNAKDLLARYGQIDEYFRDHVSNLREGLSLGEVAPKVAVERVLRQVEEQLGMAPEALPHVALVVAALTPAKTPKDLPEGFTAALVDAARGPIRMGLTTYRDFLKNELLPKAREAPGVSSLPNGAACYAARIRRQTGMDRSPEDVHLLGLSEVSRIEGEMTELVRASGGGELFAYLQVLTKRKDQHLPDSAAIVAHNKSLMQRASAALPRAFGRLPKTIIEVKPIEGFRERDAPAAYYYSAPRDGSRPAYYYINTYKPETRHLFTMAALAFHEAVPGHHLQIALASENDDLPDFQREMGLTAYVEGWALYSEGLADELGLYLTADEKLGQLREEMWRAVRLVVDTGLHAKLWSRKQALDFLLAKTGNRDGDGEAEIDRYIIWPAQALAYKLGELEIRRIRRKAEETLGKRFDLKWFHDRVLENGAVTLKTLGRVLDEATTARLSQP